MYIVQNGEVLASDIFPGRNSDWFRKMQAESDDEVYNQLPIVIGFSDKAPTELKDRFAREKGYFDHYHILVKFFKKWYETYHPDLKAGWVTTYDKWRMEKKGYIPEDDDVIKELCKTDILQDMHFVEYTDIYECSYWVYHYLIDNNIPDNADITYCFDN